MKKLKELKRSEINVTSVIPRKQLYSLQYEINRETAIQFLDRFEDIVNDYESISGSNPLSEDEKRDALYNAIMVQVPEIQSVEFITKNQTGKSLTFDSLKMFLIQAEANRTQAATNDHPTTKGNTVAAVSFAKSNRQAKWVNDRCYECDDYGHLKNECPRKGRGVKKCYECNQFTTHKGFECPQRLARLTKGQNKGKRQFNKKYENQLQERSKRFIKVVNNRGYKNLQFKRNSNNYQNVNRFKFTKDNQQTRPKQTQTVTADIPKIHFVNSHQKKSTHC